MLRDSIDIAWVPCQIDVILKKSDRLSRNYCAVVDHSSIQGRQCSSSKLQTKVSGYAKDVKISLTSGNDVTAATEAASFQLWPYLQTRHRRRSVSSNESETRLRLGEETLFLACSDVWDDHKPHFQTREGEGRGVFCSSCTRISAVDQRRQRWNRLRQDLQSSSGSNGWALRRKYFYWVDFLTLPILRTQTFKNSQALVQGK